MIVAHIPADKAGIIVGTGYSNYRGSIPRISLSLVSIFSRYNLTDFGKAIKGASEKKGSKDGITIPVAG